MSTMEGSIVYTERKEKEGSEGFIGLLFGHLARMSATLGNPELGNISGNVYLIANLIISHIPEPEMRVELRQKLKDRRNELISEEEKRTQKPLTDPQRRYFEILAATEIVGYVMDWINLHVAITKDSKLALDMDMTPCESCKIKHTLFELHPEMEE